MNPIFTKLKSGSRKLARTDPNHTSRSGWGQFLDAEGHREQIGPYGTCSAILFTKTINPQAEIDENVVAQIMQFWDDPTKTGKLKSQNIRIAFLVLALADLGHPELTRIREEAINTLIERQRSDGAWGDWASQGASGPPRPETTAWMLLALHRAKADAGAISKAQDNLLKFVDPSGSRSATSDFSAAVLLETLNEGLAPPKLIAGIRNALKRFDVAESERIRFFDFNESLDNNEPLRLRRDYLCYPPIYAFALMTSGMKKHATFTTWLVALRSRVALSCYLQDMVGTGEYYIQHGAAHAATVDQAFISLAFQCLRNSEDALDEHFAALQPIFPWVRFFFRFVIPVSLASIAIVAIQDPRHLAWPFSKLEWFGEAKIDEAISSNSWAIRVLASLYLFFANGSPNRIWSYVKELRPS